MENVSRALVALTAGSLVEGEVMGAVDIIEHIGENSQFGNEKVITDLVEVVNNIPMKTRTESLHRSKL